MTTAMTTGTTTGMTTGLSARMTTGLSARTARFAAAGGAVALTAALGVAGAATAGAATVTPTHADRVFLATAHQSNLAEIAAGKLAASKGAPADIQAEGRLWIRQHSTLDASGAALAGKYGVTLPTAVNAQQAAAAAGLRARTGSAFTTDWISLGLDGHAKTLAAVRAEIADGTNPDFVAAARTAEPIVAHHLHDLEALAADYDVTLPASVTAGTGGQAAAATAGTTVAGPVLATLGVAVAAGGGWLLLRRRVAARP